MSKISNKEVYEFIVTKVSEMKQSLVEIGINSKDLSYVFTISQYIEEEGEQFLDSFSIVDLMDETDADGLLSMTEASLVKTVGTINDVERLENEIDETLKDDDTSNIDYWIDKAKNN